MQQISGAKARPNRRRGRQMRVTSWLGLGAMTLGVGAVLVGGVGVAHADTPDNEGPSAGASAPKGGGQGHSKRIATREQNRSAATRTPKPAAATNAGARAVQPASSASPTETEVPTVIPSPAAATRVFDRDVNPAAAVTASTVSPLTSAAATSSTGSCAQCWGVGAPTIAQGLTTAVNHLFNSAFSILGDSPANAISSFLEGALVLVRRALFFIPTGISTIQVGTELTIGINTGSVGYFRQSGSNIQLADNPLFWGAQEFAASSVTDVVMGNAGNTGCAGLMFTEGTIAASLTTAGIDSINFGETAAATGAVQATMTSGPISITNGIVGYGGVTINGAVTLATDVEIDGGTGDVEFNGTVDAATAGEQSLLVTALGTTTFAGAVGSQAALSNLTTRGIAPLNIVQSSDTTSVPLYFMPNYDTKGKIQVKYGIEVGIGGNAPRYYVFDTGGQGFFAGYNEAYWQNVQLGTNETNNTYTSGNTFNAVATTTTVTIGSGTQSVTTGPVQIAAITSGGNPNKGIVFDFSDPDATPVDDRFVGDFGASWGVQPVDNQTQGLSSVLFQLPGNLSTGFIVQLGPIGSGQQLTMGLTDELRDQFMYAIPISQATGDKAGFYSVSGLPYLDQFGFAGHYTVQDPNGGTLDTLGTIQYPGCTDKCLPSIIDSGAPSTSVRLPGAPTPFPYSTDDNKALKPGIEFTAVYETTQGKPAFTWQYLSGTNSSVDAVGYSDESGAAFPGQNLNTGLNLYNQYDVMFDTELQVIWLRPNNGIATVSLGSVTTTGAQNYSQNAVLKGTYTTGGAAFTVGGVTTLESNTTIDAGAGDVTFGGTVDGITAGQQNLAVNSSGAASFMREVGGLVALGTFTSDAGGSTTSTGIATTGTQIFNDAITIGGLYTGSTFTAQQATTLGAPAAITVGDGGAINFKSTVDSATRSVPTDTVPTVINLGYALTVSASGGVVNFLGEVGGTNQLGGLTVSAGTVTAAEAVNLDGTLVTSEEKGLVIDDGATINFTGGGLINGFTDNGVEFVGASQNSTLQGFEIVSSGKNGILLADGADDVPQNYTNSRIMGNQISDNSLSGINATGPVQGLTITNNSIFNNGDDGVGLEGNSNQVTSNAISNNAGDGVQISNYGSAVSVGNQITSNSIIGNTGKGIALTNGANDDQPAPTIVSATSASDGTQVEIVADVTGIVGYSGQFLVQVFGNAVSSKDDAQGQTLLGAVTVAAGQFTQAFAITSTNQWITLTATPVTAPNNTSKFSDAVAITV